MNVTAGVAANIMAERQWQHRVPVRPHYRGDGQPLSTHYVSHDATGSWWWRRACTEEFEYKIVPPMAVGDIFWLREPGRSGGVLQNDLRIDVTYTADGATADIQFPARLLKDGKPPKWATHMQGIPNGIFMDAARTFREVTRVRVERVQDISETDCFAEGLGHCIGLSVCGGGCDACSSHHPRAWFKNLWKFLYPGSWDRNDWVLVYDLKPCDRPEGWPHA